MKTSESKVFFVAEQKTWNKSWSFNCPIVEFFSHSFERISISLSNLPFDSFEPFCWEQKKCFFSSYNFLTTGGSIGCIGKKVARLDRARELKFEASYSTFSFSIDHKNQTPIQIRKHNGQPSAINNKTWPDWSSFNDRGWTPFDVHKSSDKQLLETIIGTYDLVSKRLLSRQYLHL